MNKLLTLLESKIETYVTSFEEKPLQTIIKTFIVIWLFKQAQKLLK